MLFRSHADIDLYSPSDHYPEDNKREHAKLEASIARRAARLEPIEKALDCAYDLEFEPLEDLLETVPTTLKGVLALLAYQGDELSEAGLGTEENLERLCMSIRAALDALAA